MKKYISVFNLSIQTAMEYRTDFLLGLISIVFPIAIQLYLWTAIYSSSANINNGYSYHQIILYTLMAGITSKFTATGFEYEINRDIKDGGLNKYIIKPINYFFYRLFAFCGDKIPSSIILGIVASFMLMVATIFMKIEIEKTRIILYITSLFFAIFLNYLIYFMISMLGFWITEISKMFATIQIVLIVLSGGIFPLDIFGDGIQKITQYLPFQYTTQFSVDILNGKLLNSELLPHFTLQFSWIIVFSIASWLFWKQGIKRYVAIGG